MDIIWPRRVPHLLSLTVTSGTAREAPLVKHVCGLGKYFKFAKGGADRWSTLTMKHVTDCVTDCVVINRCGFSQ